jgi:hypothetical protein
MVASSGRKGSELKRVARLDDFGVVDDTRSRYKGYAAAASKLNPRERAAWWRGVFQRDPEMLEYIHSDSRR